MPPSPEPWPGDLLNPDLDLLQWGTLDRYIVKALWMPFLFGVGAFLGISLTLGTLFDLLRQVTSKGLPIATALQVFGLQIPSYMVLALPMAMLLASLVVYNQLSRTSELIAFRSLGVSAYRLALPALLLGLWITLLTFTLNEFVVPGSTLYANQLIDQALNQSQPAYRDRNIFYREFENDRLSRVFYARRFDGQKMYDLTVLGFVEGTLNNILVTESAQWNPKIKVWELIKGTAYDIGAADLIYQNINTFDRNTLSLSRAPLDLATETRSSQEMGIADTYHYWRLIRSTGDASFTRQLLVRLQSKLSFPFVCIIFALVGAALGLKQQQRSSSKGFGLSLIIIFGYYTVSFISRSLAEAGVLSAFSGAWLPTLAGIGIGIVLLRQANR